MKEKVRKISLFLGAAVVVAAVALGGGLLGARIAGNDNAQAHLSGGLTYAEPATHYTLPVLLSTQASNEVARSFQEQFRAVAAATMPVVVEVNVVNTVTQEAQASPFDFFFGTPRQGQPQQRQFTQQGLGSGVVVARDGETVYALTNNHVAGDADEIEVVLSDNRSYNASLVGSDGLMDLALVSFTTTDQIPIAALGDSDSLVVGDWVFAVGNPLGFQSTVTAGIVSAKGRNAQPGSGMAGVTAYIQTDAAVNQGNSGGALVNLEGEVVGINTWIASQTGGNIGLGFAIPINDAKRAISDFIESGSVAYSWLGVQTGSPGGELAADLELAGLNGAFVYGVYEDSPAGRAGLEPGDFVTGVGDTEIADSNALVRTVAALEVGERTAFTVIRDGKTIGLTVRTDRRSDSSGSDAASLWPGISVTPLTEEIRSQLSLDRKYGGVVIAAVTPESAAASSGLQEGDTVTAINGSRIGSAREFYGAINQNIDEVQFRVVRSGRELILGFVRPTA